MENIIESMEIVDDLVKKGWKITIQFDEDCCEMSAFAGDANCHHRKEYDPADGHGCSSVMFDVEDWEEQNEKNIFWAAKKIKSKCDKIVWGFAYPQKRNGQ
jgi:hypothetical protein